MDKYVFRDINFSTAYHRKEYSNVKVFHHSIILEKRLPCFCIVNIMEV